MLFDNNKLYELEILRYVEITPRLNNRTAAIKIGCSVRLAHDLLKKMVEGGWLRIEKINSRRWDYFLTDQGKHYKDELTIKLWDFSHYFYQEVRKLVSRLAKQLAEKNFRRVALIDAGEVAEIVYLALREYGLEVTAIFSDDGSTFPGIPVRPLAELKNGIAEAFIYCGNGESWFFPKKILLSGMSFPEETYTVLGEKIKSAESPAEIPDLDDRMKKIIEDIGGVLRRNLQTSFELYWLEDDAGQRWLDLRLKTAEKANMEKIKQQIADINILYLLDLVQLRQIDDSEYDAIRQTAKRVI